MSRNTVADIECHFARRCEGPRNYTDDSCHYHHCVEAELLVQAIKHSNEDEANGRTDIQSLIYLVSGLGRRFTNDCDVVCI